MKVLVCVLDGYSYMFGITFLWWNKDIHDLLKYPGAKRRMMYIDVVPQTPYVANVFFSLPIFWKGQNSRVLIKWVWDIRPDWNIKVINVPAKLPCIYKGLERPKEWIDFFTPNREKFRETVERFHRFVLEHGDGDALFVWYIIPDQAHHHFFPTVHDNEALGKAIEWYGIASRYALDLIDEFKPKRWLVLGDHGFTSDIYETPIECEGHIPESLAITNWGEPPRKASEVVYWIYKALRE